MLSTAIQQQALHIPCPEVQRGVQRKQTSNRGARVPLAQYNRPLATSWRRKMLGSEWGPFHDQLI